MKRNGSGWHGESRRHSLARKGIKTAHGVNILPSIMASTTATVTNMNTAVHNMQNEQDMPIFNEKADKMIKYFLKKFGMPDYYYDSHYTWEVNFRDEYGNDWDGIQVLNQEENYILFRKKYDVSDYDDYNIEKIHTALAHNRNCQHKIQRRFFKKYVNVKIKGNNFQEIHDKRQEMLRRLSEWHGVELE